MSNKEVSKAVAAVLAMCTHMVESDRVEFLNEVAAQLEDAADDEESSFGDDEEDDREEEME